MSFMIHCIHILKIKKLLDCISERAPLHMHNKIYGTTTFLTSETFTCIRFIVYHEWWCLILVLWKWAWYETSWTCSMRHLYISFYDISNCNLSLFSVEVFFCIFPFRIISIAKFILEFPNTVSDRIILSFFKKSEHNLTNFIFTRLEVMCHILFKWFTFIPYILYLYRI